MVRKTIIKNAVVVLADRLVKNQTVVWSAGKIEAVGAPEEIEAAAGDEVIDAAGDYLAPGFIDLHFHGAHEFRIDIGPDDLAGLTKLLPRYGVTGFLAAVTPKPKGEDSVFLRSLAQAETEGASILGFHLEGPFLTLTGALKPEDLGQADVQRVRALIEAAKPYPAVFSVAPDFPGVLDLVAVMGAEQTPVFMTHTAADVAQTQRAIEAGVRHATHFYDVFPCPPEVDPGVRPCGAAEAVLADPRVTVDFILDGEHVDPVAVRMALQCKGAGSVCLVTDANIGSGLPPGTYMTPEGEVVFAYAGGPARQPNNPIMPGALSGSGLTMQTAVRNALKFLDVDLPLAVRMASANPAAVLGLDDCKGKVAAGFDADLVLLDKALEVRQTWVAGRSVYVADA